MPRYLLSYDLDEPGPQDYDRLIAEIQRFGGKEVLRSQWVFRNDATPAALRDHFQAFIDAKTDRLIVSELDTNWAAWNPIVKISSL
jgi:CRISPR/Cas system-associated endoribonuclease Cas2